MRHIRNMHDIVEAIGAGLQCPLAQLIGDFLGSSHCNEERFAHRIEIKSTMQLVCPGSTNLQLIDRDVSRRIQPLWCAARIVLEKALKMDGVFLLSLLLCFSDINISQKRQ